MMDYIPENIFIPAVVIAVLLVLGLAFWARYKTVGPDEGMIVTGSFLGKNHISDDGSGRKIKIVRGGGAFILPVFQKAEFMSLLSHKLDVTTPEVYTEQGVPVIADGVAIIKVGSSTEDVATAAEQFMGKPIESLNWPPPLWRSQYWKCLWSDDRFSCDSSHQGYFHEWLQRVDSCLSDKVEIG